MFGIDSPEILVIAIVALIVVGPKELPGLLRGWGKWMAKARGMASEFRGHVDEMVRQSELDEVKKQIVDSTAGIDLQALDPTREIKSALNEGIAEGEKALADARDDLAKPVPEITGESPTPAENCAVTDSGGAIRRARGIEVRRRRLSRPDALTKSRFELDRERRHKAAPFSRRQT